MKMILKLISVVLILIIGSQIASASVWIDDIEIGLSEYQTGGLVNDEYVIRPSYIHINEPYITKSQDEGYAPGELRFIKIKLPKNYLIYHQRLSEEARRI